MTTVWTFGRSERSVAAAMAAVALRCAIAVRGGVDSVSRLIYMSSTLMSIYSKSQHSSSGLSVVRRLLLLIDKIALTFGGSLPGREGWIADTLLNGAYYRHHGRRIALLLTYLCCWGYLC